MSEIYDFNRSYGAVKRYIIFIFKRFYGEYIINGRENIPEEGPVIYAANHLNALMDALAVISILPHKRPIVYLARSDMFKNKKVAKVLRFSKMLPAFRMRDGLENLEKNNIVFERCAEVLDHNTALGIMPEGNQGGFRRLRPLVKGIFRIAFSAQQKYGTQPGVKIVPVGIDYNDFESFGKHIIINIGKPIEVSDYMAEYTENPIKATNKLRNRLRDDLVGVTLNLATEKHYDCFETATNVANTAVVNKLQMPNKTLYRFFARQKIAKRLVALEKKEIEMTEQLDNLCAEYKENLEQLNLHSWVLEKKTYKLTGLFVNSLLLLLTMPVFFVGFVLNMIPFFAPDIIRKVLKINFPGGLSSLRFGLGMFTFPIFYFLQGIWIYKKLNGSFWNLIIIIPLQYVFGKLSFQWYKSYKKLLAKLRYRKLQHQNSPVLLKTKLLHEQIIKIVQTPKIGKEPKVPSFQ